MSLPSRNSKVALASAAHFRTTHWSLVLSAGHGDSPAAGAALERLCQDYWYPIYAFVRRQGSGPHDAQDLTQEFFARLLRLNSLRQVGREKGRFRTFLLASLRHFLSDARDKVRAAKRGGGEPALSLDDADAEQRYASELSSPFAPEKMFDHRWALTVLNNALVRLQAESAVEGRDGRFDHLKPFLSTEAAAGTYNALAPKLGMTPHAVGMAVCRLRKRYAELVREEVAETVAGSADVDAELNYLLEVAGQ
jgi:RNA polymerase sigma-70 factor (ECF subfamily)